ncbi:hypothetical protein J4467_01340 [Candidatus Woesearchaeota archaeon]|nr:hypothetical protein [Candidatus Woesearchaeota archaeon]
MELIYGLDISQAEIVCKKLESIAFEDWKYDEEFISNNGSSGMIFTSINPNVSAQIRRGIEYGSPIFAGDDASDSIVYSLIVCFEEYKVIPVNKLNEVVISGIYIRVLKDYRVKKAEDLAKQNKKVKDTLEELLRNL